jgi:Ca2+-binding RTX toxin-like protein
MILGGPGDDTIVITATTGNGIVVDGGSGSDTYVVEASSLAGPVTISDSGSTGTDSVTVQGTAGSDTITQNGNQITPNGGTITLDSGVDALTIDGGGGSDQFTVEGTPSIAPTLQNTSSFVVQGTAGNDTINFHASGNDGDITVSLNGVNLGTYHPTARVIAYGLAGTDSIQVVGSISLTAELYGGDGNDRLKGGGGNDILIGGAGDDLIAGGSGRDMIIGGSGSDRLVGDAEDDILIAGTIVFDADRAALDDILAEWTSSRDYATRVANLMGTGSGSSFSDRLNGDTFLRSTGTNATVFDDAVADVLTGSSGLDWFLFNNDGNGLEDRVTDLHVGEFFSDLDIAFITAP